MATFSRRAAAGVVAATCFMPHLAMAADRPRLKVRELYGKGGKFSEQAVALAGERIEIPGFMAPPLKPDVKFFVLTKMPMAVCPFCDNEADWPRDIVLVLMRGNQDWVDFNRPILTQGVLELGTKIDHETGFVSRVRLADAVYEML